MLSVKGGLLLLAAAALGAGGDNGIFLRLGEQPGLKLSLGRMSDAGHIAAVILPAVVARAFIINRLFAAATVRIDLRVELRGRSGVCGHAPGMVQGRNPARLMFSFEHL
ncbi:MAG: hypothetical protein D3908_03450 [Candidatus Electrothrix sp. AUS4]|nr:hypothetical protein [Candidatus Electrothrix sp. AUS4]